MLETIKLEKLSTRRRRLCLNFARKALKHEKFRNWFVRTNNEDMNKRAKYAETIARGKRLFKSPIPYLTRLLNQNNS